MEKDEVRCTFRLSGNELEVVREVQKMVGLNSELDACRYLLTKAVEHMHAPLARYRLIKRSEGIMAPQELLPLLQGMIAEDSHLGKGGGKKTP